MTRYLVTGVGSFITCYKIGILPRTEDSAAREFTLPLYPTMGEERVEMAVDSIRGILNM